MQRWPAGSRLRVELCGRPDPAFAGGQHIRSDVVAVAAYERDREFPTLRTLHRLAQAVGLEVHCVFVPAMSREDRRSLAYHSALADKLSRDPDIVERARRTLELQKEQHPHAGRVLSLWESWLDLPVKELIAQIQSPDLLARDMRQVSPFAGVLTPSERLQVLKRFAQAEAR